MSSDDERFRFGRNWQAFVSHHLTDERVEVARRHLLDFLRTDTLSGRRVIDIGCGSGLHSLAAWRAGAAEIISFDYDPDSVATTRMLWEQAGRPANWRITQGSILDKAFVASLGTADLVYSWGVLHHTGQQWQALENAISLLGEAAQLYIALYTTEIYIDPTPEDWLALKQRYNRAWRPVRWWMEIGYIYQCLLGQRLSQLPALIRYARQYKAMRGMELWTDIRDWLGGWPMEFSSVGEVLEFCCRQRGLRLGRVIPGESNTEYLFEKGQIGSPCDLARSFSVATALADLPVQQPIYIYGAGVGGQWLAEALKHQPEFRIQAFVDRARTGDVEGIPILTPQQFFDRADRSAPVVITSQKYGDIVDSLVAAGFSTIWSVFGLVADHLRAAHAARRQKGRGRMTATKSGKAQ